MKNAFSYFIMFIFIISGFLSRDYIGNENIPILVRVLMGVWALFTIYLPVMMFWNERRQNALEESFIRNAMYREGAMLTFTKYEEDNRTIVGEVVNIDKFGDQIVYTIDEKEKSTLHLVPEAMVKPYNTETNE
jgi:hypothetical protein